MSERLSIGVIMDGNRRWAKGKGLPTIMGHEEGAKRVRDIAEWAIRAKVTHLYLYAFSTENWNRTAEEVGALMALLERAFNERMQDIESLGVRVRVIGERERFSERFQTLINDVENRSASNTNLTIVFCLSYGSRSEIARAAQSLVVKGKAEISEDDVSEALMTGGMPDPDLIIRPGGEKRLSNFLLWQSAYAELFFTDTLWPDFTEEEFSRILQEFHTREQRRGT